MKKYAIFNASFKLILKKQDKLLFLKAAYDVLDLPGGRIEVDEANRPLEEIIKREIAEELGRGVKYKLFRPVMQFRRLNMVTKIWVLVTVYEAEYLSGEIMLSDEHIKYEWINAKKFNVKEWKFYNKEERKAFAKYLEK